MSEINSCGISVIFVLFHVLVSCLVLKIFLSLSCSMSCTNGCTYAMVLCPSVCLSSVCNICRPLLWLNSASYCRKWTMGNRMVT